MRYQSRMDKGFMVAPVPRPVSWPGVAVALTLASCEFLFTRKRLAATRKAICMPETVRDEHSLEIAGRVKDTPIHDGLGRGNRHATCQSVGTSSIGLDQGSRPPLLERKPRMCQMARLSEAGRFLMLRF
jgi:hypothetical protein